MFIRIVKMHFRKAEVEAFQKLFEESSPQIRAFEGCRHLELLRDLNNQNIFFTYSYWGEPAQLEAYRHSSLFKSVWSRTKPLFEKPAEAWSVNQEKLLP